MSLVPPSRRTVWGWPRALIMARLSSEGETAGEVGLESVVRVEPRAQLAELGESGIHRRHELRAQPGVLGQVDPAAGRGHLLVEVCRAARPVRAGPGRRPRGSSRRSGTTASRSCPARSASAPPGRSCACRRRPPRGSVVRRRRGPRGRRTGTGGSRAARTAGSSAPTPSSGWKNAETLWISPSRNRGALRNQASLNARTVSPVTSPTGGANGTVSRGAAGIASGCAAARDRRAGRGSRGRPGRGRTGRARCPRASVSIQATE